MSKVYQEVLHDVEVRVVKHFDSVDYTFVTLVDKTVREEVQVGIKDKASDQIKVNEMQDKKEVKPTNLAVL